MSAAKAKVPGKLLTGRICLKGKKINFSRAFADLDVGIREVSDRIWQGSFLQYGLGYFDEDSRRFEPGRDPFGPELLPMSPE